MPDDDVTVWIRRLGDGNERAAQVIWERYCESLIALARRKLGNTPRRAFDEEDVALSAMNSFIQRAKQNHFPDLSDRNNLWKLLVAITAGKIRDQRRREVAQKRGGGQVRGESVFANLFDANDLGGIARVVADEPSPSLAAELSETFEEMLEKLGEEPLRQIALLKLEGYTNEEIATATNRSISTVERRLKAHTREVGKLKIVGKDRRVHGSVRQTPVVSRLLAPHPQIEIQGGAPHAVEENSGFSSF